MFDFDRNDVCHHNIDGLNSDHDASACIPDANSLMQLVLWFITHSGSSDNRAASTTEEVLNAHFD